MTKRDLIPTIEYCELPCQGELPCINICHHGQKKDLAMLTENGKFVDLSTQIQAQLFHNSNLSLSGIMNNISRISAMSYLSNIIHGSSTFALIHFFFVLVDKKIFEGDDFNNLHERRNFQQYNPQCDDGFELKPIRPSDSCPEIFKIILEDKVTRLHIRQDDISSTKYCLQINNDLTYEALMCKEKQPEYRET